MTEYFVNTLLFLFVFGFVYCSYHDNHPFTGHSGAVVAYWTGDLKVPGSTPSPGLGTLNQVPWTTVSEKDHCCR